MVDGEEDATWPGGRRASPHRASARAWVPRFQPGGVSFGLRQRWQVRYFQRFSDGASGAAVIRAPRSFPRILAESNLNLNQRGLCRIHVHGITAALEAAAAAAAAASRGRVARGPCLRPDGSADRRRSLPYLGVCKTRGAS